MGAYDFTYSMPSNFNKRVSQYLQQMGKGPVALAFQHCSYEYEDVGLAFYAGLRGDNWDKHALDFTFEGNEHDISLMKKSDFAVRAAIEKALKPSESGFLVRKAYYFDSDDFDESTMVPHSNEERLNADMIAARGVLDDLLKIGERLCLNASFNAATLENSLDDYFRDMLSSKGYDEVKDQTRHGLSVAGKDAAEVDILLTKAGREIAIFEGLRLSYLDKERIDEHVDKAIVNYNALGTATFIVAYISAADFEAFWKKYAAYLCQYAFPLEIKKPFFELPYPNAATRVAGLILARDGYDFPVFFVALRIG